MCMHVIYRIIYEIIMYKNLRILFSSYPLVVAFLWGVFLNTWEVTFMGVRCKFPHSLEVQYVSFRIEVFSLVRD